MFLFSSSFLFFLELTVKRHLLDFLVFVISLSSDSPSEPSFVQLDIYSQVCFFKLSLLVVSCVLLLQTELALRGPLHSCHGGPSFFSLQCCITCLLAGENSFSLYSILVKYILWLLLGERERREGPWENLICLEVPWLYPHSYT